MGKGICWVPALSEKSRANPARRLLQALAIFGILIEGTIGLLNLGNPDPDARAIAFMGLTLIAVWCVLGGTLMFFGRKVLVRWASLVRLGWKVRFVVFATLLALIEEAVTTSLTNAAPLFRAASAAAKITVSSNYLEVISNSVLAFIPWFICWAWLLGRYDFRPSEIMLLFGLTGAIAEATLDSAIGLEDFVGVAMWVYVYGLMVYLPALSLPIDRDVRPVRWYVIPVAVVLPLVFIIPFVAYVVFELARRIGPRVLHLDG
jgi:hypothetical protein